MARARHRRRSPEILAAELLARYGEHVPVEVDRIAESLGCSVVYHQFRGAVSGLLIRDKGATVIAVNRDDHENRQRFTIAHEIAHLVMHPGRPLLVDADVKVNARTPTAGFATEREETEANQFAAALLMPVDALRRSIDRIRRTTTSFGPKTVERLAGEFGVSESSMHFRLINLGLYIPH